MMEILAIKSSKRSTDGRMIAVTFETPNGPVEIVANTGALGLMLQDLAGIVSEARRADPSEVVTAPGLSQIGVLPMKDHPGGVVLRFVTTAQLEYIFGLAA